MYPKMLPALALVLLVTNTQAQTMVPKLDQEARRGEVARQAK